MAHGDLELLGQFLNQNLIHSFVIVVVKQCLSKYIARHYAMVIAEH